MANDNSGALFKNDKKREGKKDADYQGSITIEGKEFWLNAWIKTTQDGKKTYMSISAKPKQERTIGSDTQAMLSKLKGEAAESDIIPF